MPAHKSTRAHTPEGAAPAAAHPPAAHPRAIAGISGGRTSAMMAYLLDPSTVLSFQNTGREAAGTYDFIAALEQDLGRPIVRLEFRAPPRGEPPRAATFEIVDHAHLARRGEPFRDMLEMLRAFRETKGAGPIAPWARQRLCTAYLKVKTQRRYCESLGWADGLNRHLEYTEYVGLRADEPDRVARMRARNDALDTDERAPLDERGITKADVLAFWSRKPFDLGVPEHMGNCTGCFLKDERDLASALLAEETDAAWWIAIEHEFAPMRRGGRPSYAQVLAEAPARMAIRQALEAGAEPEAGALSPQRVRLIVRQERAARASFSCECDAAKAEDFDSLVEDEAA